MYQGSPTRATVAPTCWASLSPAREAFEDRHRSPQWAWLWPLILLFSLGEGCLEPQVSLSLKPCLLAAQKLRKQSRNAVDSKYFSLAIDLYFLIINEAVHFSLYFLTMYFFSEMTEMADNEELVWTLCQIHSKL